MKNNIEKVRISVCEAGIRLSAEGLVARTWGNISIRIDERTMAVTPSGIMYGDIRPEHIAVMDIITGRWECAVKPSGERKLHAAIYRARPEAGAVIHTHQLNASVCAAARVNVEVNDRDAARILCTGKIFCGGYGLPGTGKLTTETVKAVNGSMCALMANHGAVCLGSDIDEAFTVSRILENVCGTFIAGKFSIVTGTGDLSDKNVCSQYLQTHLKR
ncbi:MAG TPA: class II aldolase/adducin family protein [Spirochaetota bacterium]|nr:class II aldolase/adducin family protein [Spirochaetota bacterium]